MENAVETRAVDKELLIRVAAGRVFCAVIRRLTDHFRSRVTVPLNQRIKGYYAGHIVEAYARLDVPTFDDPMVQRQLEAAWSGKSSSVAWSTVQIVVSTFSTVIQLISQVSVLIGVLHGQRDGTMIAVLSFASPVLQWFRTQKIWSRGGHSKSCILLLSATLTRILSSVWAATCRSDDYMRMQGMKQMVAEPHHRKELIAGDMSKYLVSGEEFKR